MAIYSHCPICGMPLSNYDDVGAQKHIMRCQEQHPVYRVGMRGRPREHVPIKTPKKGSK